MKKIVLISVMCLFTVFANAQRFRSNRMHPKMVYTQVDSMKLERLPIHSTDGSSLVSLPKEMKLVVAYNSDRTKAIVLQGNPYAQRKEFNVKDDEVRQILWYKDKHLYCGYIYDKRAKACSYFEAINRDERDMLAKRLPFLSRKAAFTDEKE